MEVILSLYLFDLFIWSTGSTGKTVVAESGRLLRVKSGNPFCFGTIFFSHYLSIFFFFNFKFKSLPAGHVFSRWSEIPWLGGPVYMFILLSLVGFKLLVTCNLRCEANSDLGMENAPGVSQQHLKNALLVMVPAPGLQQYLKGTIMAMRVRLRAGHCILHYVKCPPHKWSLFIAFLTLGFPGGSQAKNLPATQETGVQSLLRKIAWGREWQPTPGFLPGEFHGELQSMGLQRVEHDWVTHTFLP